MKTLSTIITLFFAINLSYGQIITFDFQGNIGNEVTSNSNFNDAAIGVSTISRGPGLIPSLNGNAINSFNSQNWALTSIANAINGDNYVEFTIPAIQTGFSYDVTTIAFNIQRTGNGLRGMALRSSIDNFANNIDAEMPIGGGTTNLLFNVSQLNNTIAITYRLYGYAQSIAGGGRIESTRNNIEVNGSINDNNPITCVVSDDFSSATLGTEWTDVGGNSSIINNELSITSAGSPGLDYVFQDVSGQYNTNLALSNDIITWEFNMRSSVDNTSGFGLTNAGNTRTSAAFILGATNSDITIGNGYAVVIGEPGANDDIRLVRYTDGLVDNNPNLMDLIQSNTDFGNTHLSIRVIFDPNTNTWELLVRDDGVSFSNPISLLATNSQGTIVDNTFTNSNLDFIASVWSHNDQNNATAAFDNLCISSIPDCNTSTTWNGTIWDNGIPNITTAAIINANYNTGIGTLEQTSFTACSLIINSGFTLTIDNLTFVEVETDLTINGTLNVTNSAYIQIQDDVLNNNTITVQTRGNFIQVNDASSFTDNGISIVNKVTPPKPEWFFYTYWSSPVSNLNIEDIFTFTPVDRRFGFDAINYLDTNFDGVPSVGGFVPAVTGALTAGIGYAMTENPIGVFPFQRSLDFEGEFNNGEIMIPIQFNPNNVNTTTNMGAHFNFIGNPYPSALDFDAFQSANSTLIDGVAYFWSQASPPEVANNGGSAVNFSQNDYAVYTVGSGGTAGTGTVNPNAPGSTQIPNRFVPSAQGFFVISTAVGSATFNNSMRIDAATDNSSNNNFFGIEQENAAFNTSNSPVIEENRLWINLTSNNGIFNQILVAYVNGATNDYDGVSYDAPRIVPAGTTAVLYTSIDNNDSKFVIQGKAINDIDENEVIPLGFQTNIEVATTYTFSLDSFEGVFIENNTVYLRDELLNVTHNLSASDYSFTSDVGTFTNRFLVQFISSETLSSNEFELTENALTIIELENGVVQFKVSSNLEMETIKIIDLTGRELYNFEVKSNDAIYNLSILKSSVYVAQVTLSNGTVISKKAIKNN